MKAGMVFVTIILCVDAFFVSYAYGLHTRTVDVEDPSMKPYQKPVPASKPEPAKREEAPKKEKSTGKKSGSKPTTTSKSPGSKKKKH